MTSKDGPRRGEIWTIRTDKPVGAEMKKERPCVVVSSDGLGKLPLKLVVPLTAWNDKFAQHVWHVQIVPDSMNGLTQLDSADVMNLRCASVERFVVRLGRLSHKYMSQIAAAIAAVVEHE